jgi:hypothetical protein
MKKGPDLHHHGPGRAYRHDELCGGLLGLRLVARPRLPRAARRAYSLPPRSSADCIIGPDLISDRHKVGSRLRIAAQLIDAASGATHGQNALTARSTPRSDLAWQTGIKKVA